MRGYTLASCGIIFASGIGRDTVDQKAEAKVPYDRWSSHNHSISESPPLRIAIGAFC